MSIFGTRPEAIKMAPVVKSLAQDESFQSIVTVTAQHREMLDQILELFDITPDHDLDIMQHGQTLTDISVRALRGLETVLESARPDVILVHGDTLTTFIGGLAGFFQQIPVGHVEAGLRTGDPYNPFPEEMNRRLTGTLAAMHFAPTSGAQENLLREGVASDDIHVVGNTVIDALVSQVSEAFVFDDPELRRIDFEGSRVLLVTTHRRENLGEPMRRIYAALLEILTNFPDTSVVFPMHKNPAIREIAHQYFDGHERVHLVEPPEYRTFANLMARSHLILTDSGGIQEEAPSLGKPVLVLRDTTERPEGIDAGTCLKVGTEIEEIVRRCSRLLADDKAYKQMAHAVNPYGDGKAADRIVGVLKRRFGLKSSHSELAQEV